MQKRFFARFWIFGAVAVLLVGGFFATFSVRRDSVVFADDGTGDGTLKMVTIYDDGNKILLQSRAKTVRETLAAAGIVVNDFDRIEPELDDFVSEDGFVINIYRAQCAPNQTSPA